MKSNILVYYRITRKCTILTPVLSFLFPASALGDPTVTLADVTPKIAPPSPLPPNEVAHDLHASTQYMDYWF